MALSPTVRSPCQRLCRLVAGSCPACGRSLMEIQHWLLYTPSRRDEIMDHELKARLWLRGLDLTPVGGTRMGPATAERWRQHVELLPRERRSTLLGRPTSAAEIQRQLDSMDWGGQCWWTPSVHDEPVHAMLRIVPAAGRWAVSSSVVPGAEGQPQLDRIDETVAYVEQAWRRHAPNSPTWRPE